MDPKLSEVLDHEGVLSIVTWTPGGEPNVVATWNSYVRVSADGALLIPVAGMHIAQGNLQENPTAVLMAGSREVEGFKGYQGTGFEIRGKAEIVDAGPDFDATKAEFGWCSRVLRVQLDSARQLL